MELTVRGASRERVQQAAEALRQALERRMGGSARAVRAVTILGPAPHRIPRLRKTYRYCLLLKSRSVSAMVDLLRSTLQSGRRFRGMPVTIDVGPR